MTFIVQTDDGTTALANSYITAQEFKDHHADRGVDTSSFTTPDIEASLVKTRDYVDFRFAPRFKGVKLLEAQTTEWPRDGAVDRSGFTLDEKIPTQLKAAVSEYALRELSAPLAPDPVVDDTNRSVVSKREKVGPIEEETVYSSTSQVVSRFRPYPIADAMLSELLKPTRGTIRG